MLAHQRRPKLVRMEREPLTGSRLERKRAILRSAVETFAEHGFAASRTRDIAAGAGVAEGTIYLYFESKDDLLLTAFRDMVREFSDSVRDLLEPVLPFQTRLTRFIERQFRGIEEDPALATVMLLETRQSSKFYGEPVRDVLRVYATAVDALLRSGIEQGEVRADLDVPLARRILIGTLEEVELDWLLGERARPLSAAAPQVASALYRGFTRPPRDG